TLQRFHHLRNLHWLVEYQFAFVLQVHHLKTYHFESLKYSQVCSFLVLLLHSSQCLPLCYTILPSTIDIFICHGSTTKLIPYTVSQTVYKMVVIPIFIYCFTIFLECVPAT